MVSFASYDPTPFGSVASAARSPFGNNPLPFGASGIGSGQNTYSINIVSSPSPFGSNPLPFGCNVYTTNSSITVSFGPTLFGSNPLPFGGNAFTAGTLCNTSLGSSQTSNNLGGGSLIASYHATNESDSPTNMDIYANKSYEELRHEDYQMNNKGFGRPTSMFGFPQSSANSIFDLSTRNPFDLTTQNLSVRVTQNPFSQSLSPFTPPKPNNPFSVPSPFTPPKPNNPFSVPSPFTPPPKPNNPFSVPSSNLFAPSHYPLFGAPSTNPFLLSLAPFSPPKSSDPFSVPSINFFTPQTQGFSFPTSTTTPTPKNPFFGTPSTNFDSAPASVPTPVGNINWGPFTTFAQPLPQNNVETRFATPTVSQAPCMCCSIPVTTLCPCAPILNVSKPDVVSTTRPTQPSQTVKEVGNQDTNGQQNISSSTVSVQPTVVSTTQPEIVASVQNGIPSLPVETDVSVGMSSLSIGRSPTDTYEKGEATENKALASFRVNVGFIDIDDVSSFMPKLPPGEEYYTVPSIEELEAKEIAEPGFCSHVKDFVVGRKDKGSIKFLGETDVRELDIESIVQFNDREVVVYSDETKKPPVGQGLNKPAEVTLLNVKCISKLTGKLYIEGPLLHKYKHKLMDKAEEIGAKFVSFKPDTGVWKFRVSHF